MKYSVLHVFLNHTVPCPKRNEYASEDFSQESMKRKGQGQTPGVPTTLWYTLYFIKDTWLQCGELNE